jgi:hypothetical protein
MSEYLPIPSTRKDVYRNSFFPRSIREWNNRLSAATAASSVEDVQGHTGHLTTCPVPDVKIRFPPVLTVHIALRDFYLDCHAGVLGSMMSTICTRKKKKKKKKLWLVKIVVCDCPERFCYKGC